MAPQRIISVVLAAGAGRRFGGRKQLAQLRGRPLLEHALAVAESSPSDETVVVLGAFAVEIEREVGLGSARVVHCRDWELGRGASLRAALRALRPDVAAALVTLGDEPFLQVEAMQRLLSARQPGQAALRAGYGGRPGHPVLIERELFAFLIGALPAVKPGTLLRDAGLRTIDCSDLPDPADVDTPAQLAALQEKT